MSQVLLCQVPIPGSGVTVVKETGRVHDLETNRKSSLSSNLYRLSWMLRHVQFLSAFDEVLLKSGLN